MKKKLEFTFQAILKKNCFCEVFFIRLVALPPEHYVIRDCCFCLTLKCFLQLLIQVFLLDYYRTLLW